MKYFTSFLLIFFLCVSPSFSGFSIDNKIIEVCDGFSPQDILLSDDAYHGRGLLPFTEWWYFDAMFNNGYSASMTIRVISVLGKGYMVERLDLYKEGVLVTHDSTSYSLSEIIASSEIPFLQTHEKTILRGSKDNITGKFLYNVSFDFPGSAAMLSFVGCTKGWKGQLKSGDWWAVILPRAIVTGTITIQNITINVEGTGYHDHNWNVSAKTCVQLGWFWGKFNSPEYTATWAAILTTQATVQPIIVINKKNAEYISIPSETIWFSSQDFHLNHFIFVPHFFNIETMTDEVLLDVKMDASSIEHERFMSFMNYYRYHVKCSGIFMVNGHAETVDGVFIAEYVHFR